MLYLINAVAFDAEWQDIYKEYNLQKGEFVDINKKTQNVDFMYSSENRYLDDGKATGFIKPYVGNLYSFAALLPNEGIDITEYINSLTGSGFIDMIKNAEDTAVQASIPKFEYEYGIQLNAALKALGMPEAFDENKADFTKMAKSSDGNIYIGEVLHKTYISVTERGTRAGAATKVAMAAGGIISYPKTVWLERPFVFAIIDNATSLPVFIGTVMSIG
jgi:serpin B